MKLGIGFVIYYKGQTYRYYDLYKYKLILINIINFKVLIIKF